MKCQQSGIHNQNQNQEGNPTPTPDQQINSTVTIYDGIVDYRGVWAAFLACSSSKREWSATQSLELCDRMMVMHQISRTSDLLDLLCCVIQQLFPLTLILLDAHWLGVLVLWRGAFCCLDGVHCVCVCGGGGW